MKRSASVRRASWTVPALGLLMLALAACSGGGSGGSGGSSGGGSSGGSGGSSGGTSPPPVTIATTSLPNGEVDLAYSATLSASGGTPPYTWTVASGTLPAGLSLTASSGVLSGYPSWAVSAQQLNFKVSDSSNPVLTHTAMLPLTIAPAPLAIRTKSLPDAAVGVQYSASFAATGGTPPYSWQFTSGTLPTGINLNGTGGVLFGVPTTPVNATPLTLQVGDSGTPQQTKTVSLTLTVAVPLTLTPGALPCGLVGAAYSATLDAAGGTPPYTWSRSGSLPSDLEFQASGASASVTGTPGAGDSGTAAALTFQVTDSGNPQQSANIAAMLTLNNVCITPARTALTVGQTLAVSASTSDGSAVTWSLTPGGTQGSSASGAGYAFTAPTTAGVYTLTATDNGNSANVASIPVGVTNLAGVYTYHNDAARDGANTQEYALTSSDLSTATFGKLFSCAVDGAVYAQPLWAANVSINGAVHNVVFVATQHDSVFALDADSSSCQVLWQASLIDTTHGGSAGEVTVPSGPCVYGTSCYVGVGIGDIQPEVGITSTPVIDASTGTLYVLAKSMVSGQPPASTTFIQRLHALDYTTGAELAGSPVLITATYPGNNDGGTVVSFNPQTENQRAGLAQPAPGGPVYVAWGSHEDTAPYYGWLMGYTYAGSQLSQTSVFCATPNAGNAGIWMAGGAPSSDAAGHLYVITSNGLFDVTNTPPGPDYGDSFLQLTPGGTNGVSVSSYFTPFDQATDFTSDADAGSGGSAVVLNLSTAGSGPQHLVAGGGKDGMLFLLNGDSMGGAATEKTNSNAWQAIQITPIFSTGAFWNSTYFVIAAGGPLLQFPFDTPPQTQPLMLSTSWTAQSPEAFGFPGATPSISASGTSSGGIVWALATTSYCTSRASACGPVVLHAFDAANVAVELWNSTMVSGDAAGYAVKFTVPTVANGRVYVGDRGNNTGGAFGSTSASGQLDVYGLKPN
jgi:hypothetical protein